jgi:glucosamine 6-phosphate synthetase-like amidotransferase/phosphosugar isomerase protein
MSNTNDQQRPNSHPYYMYQHIQAQPDSIQGVLNDEANHANQLAQHIVQKDIDTIHIVGMGTSYHCALVGEWWFRTIACLSKVFVWQSFEVC